MGNVIPFEPGATVPAVLKDLMGGATSELSDGIGSGGFAVVSFRASKWRVKYQGEEYPILNSDGDPVSSLEAVIVKANGHVSKNYYAAGYTEGAKDAPDCFSLDGIAPDNQVQNPVSAKCGSCPKNVFGSRVTDSGKKAKACSDNKRLACGASASTKSWSRRSTRSTKSKCTSTTRPAASTRTSWNSISTA